ncbi:MAG: type II toxin-antitoxin system PemK/MazF family toxin [Gemmatimonadota bacterium]
MAQPNPSRSEVWMIDPNPTRGREQAGIRPALVISVDRFNDGPAGLVIVAPLTTRDRGLKTHIRIDPPMGGTKATSFIMTDAIRSISKERLIRLCGTVDSKVMAEVGRSISILLGL